MIVEVSGHHQVKRHCACGALLVVILLHLKPSVENTHKVPLIHRGKPMSELPWLFAAEPCLPHTGLRLSLLVCVLLTAPPPLLRDSLPLSLGALLVPLSSAASCFGVLRDCGVTGLPTGILEGPPHPHCKPRPEAGRGRKGTFSSNGET